MASGGRSTIDAVRRVRALSKNIVSRDGVELAIPLDVVNEFVAAPESSDDSNRERLILLCLKVSTCFDLRGSRINEL